MKFVMAVIKPHKLDAVREALAAPGVEGMARNIRSISCLR